MLDEFKYLIPKLQASGRTVFGTDLIAIISEESNPDKLRYKIRYLVRSGQLIRIRKGIYSFNESYDNFELANLINRPSYISLQTVLIQEACIFQYYPQIFLMSYIDREIKIKEQIYVYKSIKESVLLNPLGIKFLKQYSIACRERALLDMIYIYPEYYFDNLKAIDWDKAFEIAEIYQKKSVLDRLNKYYKENK
jgi:hypothetical protein